ncbi:MAG: ARPP-1 family domain-containing protein [Promethearchaeota archaeon]
MKSESIKIVESIFENPLGFLRLSTPQVYENMTVIPIIIQDDKFIDFISVKQAEEQSLIEIIETEAVSQLEVINKSDKQILIPFGMTVHGGKQDRTIWEPILLPVGGKQKVFNRNPGNPSRKYVIPAKCIEQSRWTYTKGKGFKSSSTRIHPNVAFEAISTAGQGAVWQEIQAHRAEMKYAMNIAPTQSYLEMTKISDKQTEKFIRAFKNVENQCGIAVFINKEFIGIEFYANPNVWRYMSEDIFKAFAIEAIRFKNKPMKEISSEFHDILISILQQLSFNYSSREGIGLGNVIELDSTDNKWRGIALEYNGTIIQFYLVSKRGGYQAGKQSQIQFQTAINQRYSL